MITKINKMQKNYRKTKKIKIKQTKCKKKKQKLSVGCVCARGNIYLTPKSIYIDILYYFCIKKKKRKETTLFSYELFTRSKDYEIDHLKHCVNIKNTKNKYIWNVNDFSKLETLQ